MNGGQTYRIGSEPHPEIHRRTDLLVRVAVVLAVVGLLLLLPVVFTISALAVGLYMLGSALVALALLLYVIAVVVDLRRGGTF